MVLATAARLRPTRRAIVVLRHAEFVGEPREGPRFLDRIEVRPLQVLDEREFEELAIRDFLHDDGHALEAGDAGSLEAALPGDKLIRRRAEIAAHARHDHRLQHAVLADAVRQFAQRCLVELRTRLMRIRDDEVDVHRLDARAGFGLGDQG